MNCPKCTSAMEKVEYQSIEIDRCKSCHGIWLDWLEAEQLKNLKGSEQIDIGEARQGKIYNKIDKIECPKCHTQMGKMVDNHQPHIWYEYCDLCFGIFFDAGEFRDYKEENILDFFKDLFSDPRR